MNRPGFLQGVFLALFLSVIGSAAFNALDWIISGRPALQTVITGLSFIYIFFLLKRSHERVGRITVMTFWILLTAILWLIHLPTMLFLITQAGMLWLVRSLYYYAGILSSIIDLSLTATGLAVAVWAGLYTDNIFFSIWSFFLIQALFVTIPVDWKKRPAERHTCFTADDPFEQAWQCAEAAVKRLSSVR